MSYAFFMFTSNIAYIFKCTYTDTSKRIWYLPIKTDYFGNRTIWIRYVHERFIINTIYCLGIRAGETIQLDCKRDLHYWLPYVSRET